MSCCTAADFHRPAPVAPADLRTAIRLTLSDIDSKWDDDTGDGALSPDYLDRLADGVLATVVEFYAKEPS